MARLYSDEQFPRAVVEVLRNLGPDVLTCRDAGQANRGIGDQSVLQFALSDRRAILTRNRKHFLNLHRRSASHAGIVACTRNPDAEDFAGRIDAAIASASASIGSLAGQYIRVVRPSRR